MHASGEIFVVDDDETMRDALTLIFTRRGYQVRAFADGETFLAAAGARQPACILLDVGMPGRSGLDILKELNAQSCGVPVIIISGQGDIPMAVDAIRAGAFDFIEKPFDANTVVTRVREATAAYATRKTGADESDVRDVLTAREREVLEQIVSGASVKEAARHLGISPRTLELHRARVIKKLGAKNVADLVRIALIQQRRREGNEGGAIQTLLRSSPAPGKL